jgi:hypothetical protein
MTDAKMPLKIDLDELIFALETNDPMIDSYLDLETGDVVTTVDGNVEDDIADLLEEHPERFCFIRPLPSREAFRIMENFAEEVEQNGIRARLFNALGSRHPFRTFKDVLQDYPELRVEWFAFNNEAMRELAERWLEEEEIAAVFTK